MKKHVLFLFATLLSLATSAHDFEIGGIYYNNTSSTNHTVEVTFRGDNYLNYDDEYSGSITIPATVNYIYSVTSIGNHAFFSCNSLTAITIPESVTRIGDYAFSSCNRLTAINIPEGVKSIGNYAFAHCSSLTTITIPENSQLTSIGEWAFYNCESLNTVINYSDLPLERGSDDYGYVANYAVRVINVDEVIDGYAFKTIEGVHYLTGYIGDNTELTLPADYKGENYQIGDDAFRGCSSLKSITIPEGVTSIGEWAFYYCESLTSITLPEGVTSIGDYAFHDCYDLSSITIPESVTSIGDDAFSNCYNLSSITIPEDSKLTSIGRDAFSYCSSLKGITLPESVTSIGVYAFRNCSSLTAINIPKGVKSIGECTFSGCSSLKSITIPEDSKLTSIGWGAFKDCSSITAITLPEGVTSIESSAFSGCSRLTAINIPEGVTSIGDEAFSNCSSLKTVINYSDLPLQRGSNDYGKVAYYADRVINVDEVIDGYAFKTIEGVHYLTVYIGDKTELTLPADYKGENYQIGDEAFEDCSSLTAINIPESVTSIGSSAFRSCSSLKSITIPENVTSIGDYAFYNCYNLTTIILPENVTSIGDEAFSNCRSLKTVINYSDLPLQRGSNDYGRVAYYADRVINVDEVIDGYAFKTIEDVHYLTGYIGDKTELTLPADYKGENYQIGDDAFYKCSSLTAITIPEGVTSIGSEAFSYCSSLTTITLPESVTSIGIFAFDGCESLTAVHISSLEVWCNIDFAIYSANPLSSAKNLYLNGSLVTELTIPNSVTAIKNYAFWGCSSLTAITIPESVTSIGGGVFRGCSSLTAITLPEGVTNIGTSAFLGCSSLTAITIPESVTSIGDHAFRDCSSLTAITIPEGVTSIGNYAFRGCSSLTAINIPESVTSIGESAFSISSLTAIVVAEGNKVYGSRGSCNAIIETASNTLIAGCSTTIIPEGVTSIGYSAFEGCSSLTAITIPEGVTSIGYGAFQHCSSLTAITLPEGVTSIEYAAFACCSSLTTVVLPKSVEYIGSEAFAGCPELTDVYCYAETVPNTNTDAFGSYINCATLHVPVIAMNDYKNTAPWSGFGKFEATSIDVERITLSRSSATLTEGETLTLTAMVAPDDATDKAISWSSSNPSVASVDNTGKVTAIAPGTATITATANDGSGVSAQCEVTVTPASYVITFLVDGEVILTNTLTRGSTINLPDVPEKEGYTFSGWNEVPETMPAKDVTVSGTFIVNKYLVTFKIGDEVIAAKSFEYGAAIVAPKAPAKEGYTFSGWSEVPETMPAKNVTVSGTFIVNKYLVTFKIDDVVFASYSLEYGATITLPSTPPTREGYTFSGWGEVAETVPANDVTYSAYYIANVYMVYYFAEDKLVNMVEVTYGEPIPEYIYEPTTEGDEFLGWIGETYATMPAHDVTYTANISSDINAMSMDKGQQTIVIYDLHGRRVTNPIKGGIYIINGRKVIIK